MAESSKRKMLMYVVTHKPFDAPDVKGYCPIAVGPLATSGGCQYECDNTGLNISAKNANYCELTALYWIANNSSEQGIVGLSHYRRYFSNRVVFPSGESLLTASKADSLLKKHDIILPEKWSWTDVSIWEQYCRAGIGHSVDLEITRTVISDLEPSYLDAFDVVFRGHSMSCFNMLVTHRHTFNAYADWLFRILFEVEKRVDISDYDTQEARVFGYLSERLLNVWVLKNRLNACFLPVVNTEVTRKENIKNIYRHRYKGIKTSVRLSIQGRGSVR